MNKALLEEILDQHAKLAVLWHRVADERCRENDTYGIYDAVRRAIAHDKEARTLRLRYIDLGV